MHPLVELSSSKQANWKNTSRPWSSFCLLRPQHTAQSWAVGRSANPRALIRCGLIESRWLSSGHMGCRCRWPATLLRHWSRASACNVDPRANQRLDFKDGCPLTNKENASSLISQSLGHFTYLPGRVDRHRFLAVGRVWSWKRAARRSQRMDSGDCISAWLCRQGYRNGVHLVTLLWDVDLAFWPASWRMWCR